MSMIDEVIYIIDNERQCVLRQDTPKCDRDCKKCDLVLPTRDVLTAYTYTLQILYEVRKKQNESKERNT